MSIYSELSTLFKLSQEINEIRELQLENEEEEIKDLANEFIDTCNNLLSLTIKTDDENFIVSNFLNNNINLIKWLKQNYLNEKINNFFENLKANFKKQYNNSINKNKYFVNNIIEEEEENNYNEIENNNNNIQNLKNSSSCFNLIEENYFNNKHNNNNNNQNMNYNNQINNVYNNINSNINFNNNSNYNNNNNNYNNNINNHLNNYNINNINNNYNNNINNNIIKNDNDNDNDDNISNNEDNSYIIKNIENNDIKNSNDNQIKSRDDKNMNNIDENEGEEEEEEIENDEKSDNSIIINNNKEKKKEIQNCDSNPSSDNEKENENSYIINDNNNKKDNKNEKQSDGKNNKIQNDNSIRVNNIIISDDENSSKEDNENNLNNNKSEENNKFDHCDSGGGESGSDSDSDSSSSSNSEVGDKETEIDNFLREPIKDILLRYQDKEDKDNNFNILFNKIKDISQNNIDKLGQKYKNKLITLICILFPFSSIDQKKFLYNISIDDNLDEYLKKNLLFFDENDEKYKYFTDILKNIPKKKDKKIKKELIIERNLFITSEEELLLLYQFLLVYRIFGSKNDKNIKTFDDKYYLKDFSIISFKLYFILTHQEFFSCISENILDIYERLLFMKNFYSTALVHKLVKPYIISKMKKNKKGYVYNNYILGDKKNINIADLFDEDELKLHEDVIRKIKYFYKIDENKGSELLFYSCNRDLDNKKYNFLLNMRELLYTKNNLISKDVNKIKTNLIRLERNIRNITKNIFIMNDNNSCSQYFINKKMKSIYYKIVYELKNNINIDNIDYYPVGSLTEFLFFSDKKNKIEDNLNIYLDIHKLSPQFRKNAMHKIFEYLKKYNAKKKINSVNCLFYLRYEEININFIILGLGAYIHSVLFRAYSLMDARFPIIALTLKYFLVKIQLRYFMDKVYLNTFSLMSLLIAFLQDIISPPILPKIFSDKKSETFSRLIPFTSSSNEKKINPFIETLEYKYIHMPKNLFYKDKLINIYKEQIGDNKNNLSCAQIFLNFLEFLIYYFKSDAVYVNCSLEHEGFDSMNNIINDLDDINYQDIKDYKEGNEIEDKFGEKYPNDIYFKEYIKKNYFLNNKNKFKNIIGGFYLIRDPVNPFYNPGDTLNKKLFETFFTKIKKGYDILLKTGSFDSLDELNKVK